MSLKRTLDSRSVLGFRLIHDRVDDVEPRFAFVEGSRDQFGVSWDRYGTSGRLTLGYQLELNDRNDPNVSPTRNRLSLRYRYSMNPQWATDMRVSLRHSAYDDLLVTRDEVLVEVSLGFLRNFAQGWQINGEYRWSDNDSNVAAFSYTRSRFTLGLTKNF